MLSRIPLSSPSLGDAEAKAAFDSVKSGWLTQNGREVALMEKAIFDFVNKISERNFVASATSNGTTALHLALLAANVGAGDEVVVPDFGYAAVINAVIYCGATPVVVDVAASNWSIDPQSLQNVINRNTKAVIAVDNYGFSAPIAEIRDKVDSNIVIIQDSAESFPCNFEGVRDGDSLGDIITTSFYANKVFTSGEGGAVIANEARIAKINNIKNQGLGEVGTFSHIEVGYNYRITNVQASIFNAQWARYEELIKRRRDIFSLYGELLARKKYVIRTNASVNPWLFTIQGDFRNLANLRRILKDDGIETRPGFTPFSKMKHLEPFLKKSVNLGQSHLLSQNIICLPTFPEMTDDQIRYIVDKLDQAIATD
jgi:perosamine synthetase